MDSSSSANELKLGRHEESVRYEGLDGETVHIGDPEDAQSSASPEKKTGSFTVDEAVNSLGFGKFQIKLFLITGLAWMADAMELTILAIISPSLQCEWGISQMEQAMITTVVFCGMMLSSTFWGNICDRYGRKMGLTASSIMTFVMGAISAIAPNYYVLLVLRALTGFGIGGVPQAITLYTEFLPTTQRARCVVLIEAFWAIGAASEAVLAYFVMHSLGWRYLLFFSSLPMLVFCLLAVWLPESARFQMGSGNVEYAYKTLSRMAQDNGKVMLSGDLVDNSAIIEGKPESRGNLLSLLSHGLRRTTLLLWFIWCANSFAYYGMVLFTTVLFQSDNVCHGGVDQANMTEIGCRVLGQDDYFDILKTTLAEFPGLILTVFTIEYFGRKKTMAAEFGMFTLFTSLLMLCVGRKTMTVFLFAARAFISGAFQCIFVYTPEVYPTTHRAVGLGASSAMARLGAIITPFLAQVAAGTSLYIPIIAYASVGLMGMIACCLLPIETKGRQMKESHT